MNLIWNISHVYALFLGYFIFVLWFCALFIIFEQTWKNSQNSVKCSSKRQDAPGVKSRTIDRKRQKKTYEELNDANMEINAPSGGKSSVVLDQAPCAFCHSSKQSEVRFKTKLSCIS